MRWNQFPFLRYLIALTGGILLYHYQILSWKSLLGMTALAGALLVGFPFVPAKIRWYSGFAGLGVLVGLGGLLTWQADEKQNLQHFIHQKEPILAYQAVLSSAVEKKPGTYRVIAEIKAVKVPKGWISGRGKILLFIDRDVTFKPTYGDVLLIRKSPERVEPPYNPDEFDYRAYLSHQGIYHQQYLHTYDFAQLSHQPPSGLIQAAVTLNEQAASLLAQKLPTRAEYAVAAAMLLGVRDELDNALLQAYSAAGAVHALSVSGMHVGILFLVLSWLLSSLRKGSIYQKWLFVSLVTAFLWGYALLTGLSGPVLRSAIMLSVFVWSDTFRLSRNAFNTLAFSAFLILLFNPYSLFQIGFQLSYLSVAGLIYLYPKLHWLWKSDTPLWAELWSLSCGAIAAQLVTYPLAVYYFHQFPTYFLVVNPLVMAFSSLGLIVGLAYLIFASVPLLNDFLVYVLKLSFGGLNVLVKKTESLPGALWNDLLLTPVQLIFLYGLLVLMILLFSQRQKIYVWLSLSLVTLFSGSKLYAFTQHRQQQIICIHHLKKHTAISLIKGREMLLVADSSLYSDRRTQSLHLVPFWTTQDIRSRVSELPLSQCRSVTFGTFIRWQSRSILWIHESLPKYTSLSVHQPLDLLLITNNAIRYPGDWLGQLPVKQVVLDATNSKMVIKRWTETCRQLRIPCYDVRTSGAFVYQH